MPSARHADSRDRYQPRDASASQPNTLKGISWSVPDMFVKAYRFVGEMEEIAEQSGRKSTAAIYNGIADLYREIAADN